MKKYKIFGVVMSSMLILGTASSTMVAVADSVDEALVVSTNSDGESLNNLFNDLKTITFDSLTLTEAQTEALEGFKKGTYSIKVEVDENTTYISLNEVDEKIISHFESQKALTFVSNEDEDVIAQISFSELFELTNSFKENLNMSIETELKDTDAVEEIPEAIYVPRDYSTEENVSFSRSSEVENQLHGQTTNLNTFSSMMRISSSEGRQEENGLYTVLDGDTFNAIASSFNLSTRQLKEWNGHVSDINKLIVGTELAVTRRGVESLLSESDKERLYRGGAEAVFTLPQEFIDEIATRAIEVSNQEDQEPLWPSLMIAQAAHESNYGRSSLASPPYHNLSGIKGSHNGKSVLMWTWEVLDGVRVDVLAPFRHYPSYDASLQSYASLLRNGLSWNRKYYAGTWRSNTKSVWEVLEKGGLRGYATDPNYYAAIKRIIDRYDLTKYDTGNYYVRTGTFLGEAFTQLQVNKISGENKTLNYKVEVDTAKKPYAYRRIETTEEFLGEAGAQRVIDTLRENRGWGASMIETGNGTERHRVRSGFFNTLERAELALNRFKDLSGYGASIDKGSDGKYRILTGFFNGASSAQSGLNYMHQLGWGASIIPTGNYTPHYVVRTGTFNTPNHVNSAEVYFDYYGWGSKQVLDSRNNPYYRIYAEGFVYEEQANAFVSHLSNLYNWSSTAFPVQK